MLIIVIVGISVLLVVEVGLRHWLNYRATDIQRSKYLNPILNGTGAASHAIYRPHHYMLYAVRNNYSNKNGMRHNGIGLRDERDFGAKKDEIRIVFLGGSTVYDGWIQDNQKTYAPILEAKLNVHYNPEQTGQRIEVINTGLGGATSAESLMRLIFVVSEVQPDVVVIQHGLNDIWPRMYGIIQSDYGNFRRIYSVPSLRNRGETWRHAIYRRMIDRSAILTMIAVRFGYKSKYNIAKMVTRDDVTKDISNVVTNSAAYFERNTRYMVALCRAMGARVVLATEPYNEKASEARKIVMPEHNAILKKIAGQEDVMCFDFSDKMQKDIQYMKDGVHVNEEGGRLKAELYFKYFRDTKLIESILEAPVPTSHTPSVSPAVGELLENLKNDHGNKEDDSDI